MPNLNRVFLMGNLTRDPELRYVPSGTAVATFTIAMNRAYNTQTGEKKEEVTFVRVVAWGRMAEVCGEYLSKGSPVFVEGRLQSRTWEGQDGQKRSTLEVIANSVQFLRSPARQQEGAQEAQAAPPDEIASIDLGNDATMPRREANPPGAASDGPKRNGEEAPF
jgi:single-strand DNA-binding protein